MKNLVKIFVLSGILIPSLFFGQTRCDSLGGIVKGMLNENNDSFYSNGQSYKYFFGEDENAEIITTFYEGTTYRIATSAGLEDNYMIFEILDQKRNLLFSNTDFSNEPYWDFKVENTLECTIEAKLDPNKKLNGCAQLIIAFKKGN
tara:strand:- start:285 stop:722 length:438 start_codon:yes stop_codon:yes gene_type:complete